MPPTETRPGVESRTAPPKVPFRILFLDSLESWGGGQRWCVDTALGLGARGHRVFIACTEGSALASAAQRAGLEVWTHRRHGITWPMTAMNLAHRAGAEGVEVVVGNVGRDLRVGAVIRERTRARLIQRRGIDRPMKRNPRSWHLYRYRVDRVVANCESIARTLRESAPKLDPSRFPIIPNAVAPDASLPPFGSAARREERARFRRGLGLDPDAFVVTCVARLSAMKGHGVLLDAWGQVQGNDPGASLLIVGEGDEGAPIANRLEREPWKASVHMLGFREDTRAILAHSDLLALPSLRDEGCNNTLLEAMVEGTPAVVSNCGGLPEAVDDGESGTIVPMGDPSALASAIEGAIEDPSTLEAWSERCRAIALDRYGIEPVLEQWETLFEELRNSRGRAGMRGPVGG